MTRYSFYIAFILSLLIPLQATATMMKSIVDCPGKMTMHQQASADHHCGEKTAPVKSHCHHMQNCQGCSVSCHLYTLLPSAPFILLSTNTSSKAVEPLVISFQSAERWRPPIYS